MCGRFYVAPDDRLAEIIERLNRERGINAKTGEVCPGDNALVYVNNGGAHPEAMKWGLDVPRGRPVINARSETLLQRPMFSGLLRCRALVPAETYYEWDPEKRRHEFGCGAGFYMAALFRPSDNNFVIITREAATALKSVHNRMPVIFTGSAARAWLASGNDPMRVIENCQTDTVTERPRIRMEV